MMKRAIYTDIMRGGRHILLADGAWISATAALSHASEGYKPRLFATKSAASSPLLRGYSHLGRS